MSRSPGFPTDRSDEPRSARAAVTTFRNPRTLVCPRSIGSSIVYSLRKWLPSLACLAALTALKLQAADGARLYTETMDFPEGGEVKAYVIATKDYRSSFIPPPKWIVRFDHSTGAATLIPPGLEAGISINVVARSASETAATLSERLHAEIRKLYPDAELAGEFTCFAGGRRGCAVDFERRIGKEAVLTIFRRAMFAFDGGTVEFELKTSSARFPQYHHAYGALLSSFRITFSGDQPRLADSSKPVASASERPVTNSDAWSD